MNFWKSIPNVIPINGISCYVRQNYWFGAPFEATFDSTSQTWTDVEYGFEYPVWSVSRWRYSDANYEEAFNLPLVSTGTGAGVATFGLRVSSDTTIHITGDAYFYDDAGGTTGANQSRSVLAGANRTFYLKVLSGNSTMYIDSGQAVVTQFNEWTASTNAPSIYATSISDMPVNLTYFQCIGNNTINGSLSDFASSVTSISLYGQNTTTGQPGTLPPNLEFLGLGGYTTFTGNVADFPVSLVHIQVYGSNTLYGDVANFSNNVNYILVAGNNEISSYSGKTWMTNISTFYLTGLCSLNSAEVDNLLIDLDTDLSFSSGNTIRLQGNCAPRTAASDAAVSDLTSQGVTVTTN